jgi:hypothetical protein
MALCVVSRFCALFDVAPQPRALPPPHPHPLLHAARPPAPFGPEAGPYPHAAAAAAARSFAPELRLPGGVPNALEELHARITSTVDPHTHTLPY